MKGFLWNADRKKIKATVTVLMNPVPVRESAANVFLIIWQAASCRRVISAMLMKEHIIDRFLIL